MRRGWAVVGPSWRGTTAVEGPATGSVAQANASSSDMLTEDAWAFSAFSALSSSSTSSSWMVMASGGASRSMGWLDVPAATAADLIFLPAGDGLASPVRSLFLPLLSLLLTLLVVSVSVPCRMFDASVVSRRET